MTIEGKQIIEGVAAGADLSAKAMLYKVITVSGTIAAESDTALGLLKNAPESGQHAAVAVEGKMKGHAKVAIAKGARVMVTTSGYLTTVASGDGAQVGKALEAANSGDLFSFYGNFATANTKHNQL